METKRFTVKNNSFTCRACHNEVAPLKTGCRNHCPHCLYSMHLDILPGDRAADCGGLMEPTDIYLHSKKGYMITHRCLCCGHQSVNKLAMEAACQPDDLEVILDFMRNHS